MAEKPPLYRIIPMLIAILFAYSWFIRIDQIMLGKTIISTLGIDSDQYLSIAGQFLGVSTPLVGAYPIFESGIELRLPAYPALLALALKLSQLGLSLNSSIALLHTALFFGSAIWLVFILQKTIPARSVVIAFVIAAIPMRHYFFMLLAEWQTLCFLTLFIAALTRLYWQKTAPFAFAPVLFASAATLTRPDYMILFPLSYLIIFIRIKISFTLFRNVLLGSLPVLLLIAVNAIEFKRLTLSPTEGQVIALISTFSSPEEIEAQIKSCDISNLHITDLKTIPNPSLKEMLLLAPGSLVNTGSKNLRLIIEALSNSGLSQWREKNNCMMSVSRNLLFSHFNKYLHNLGYSLLTLIWITPMLVVFFFWKHKRYLRDSPQLQIFFILAVLIHVAHVLFVSSLNIMHLRYYLVTFCPVVFGISMLFLGRLNSKEL